MNEGGSLNQEGAIDVNAILAQIKTKEDSLAVILKRIEDMGDGDPEKTVEQNDQIRRVLDAQASELNKQIEQLKDTLEGNA